MPTVPSMVSQQLGLLSTGADPADVREGQSFIKPGSLAIQSGTMTDNGNLGTIIPGTTDTTIPEGYTSGGVVQGDPDLLPTNIKAGTDIFGVTGTAILAVGNATPANVLMGVTFSSSSGLGTGTMPNNGSLGIIIPDTTTKTIPAGYTTGGTVAGSANLIPSNIRSGTSIYGVAGSVIPASGSATADKLLLGETASTAAGLITGTMPNNGSLGTITPGTTSTPIPLGYTSGGSVAGSGNLQPGNIRLGVNIFGVSGTLDPGTQTGGTASSEDVLSGETFTNDSGVQTGSMPNNGAVNITPGATSQTIPIGYHNGSGTVIGDSDLQPGNIKNGVNIFGVVGTLDNTIINGQTQVPVIYAESIAANDPIYTTKQLDNDTTFSANPAGIGRSIAWSPDDVYLAVGHNNSPFVTIYKRSGKNFTKLTDPAVLPTGAVLGLKFSPDGTYLAIGMGVSPYISIYKRSGDTFTKLADPAVLPTSTSYSVSWSPDGLYLAVTSDNAPTLIVYKRSGDTFTKLADPTVLPASVARSVAFSPDGLYLALGHTPSPYLSIYKRSGDTFTKLADPATLPPGVTQSLAWNGNGNYIVVGSQTTPFISIYKRSGDVFTKLANPSYTPLGSVLSVAYKPGENIVSIGMAFSPFLVTYRQDGDVFTKLSDPSTLPAGTVSGIAYSTNGTFLAIALQAGNNVMAYSQDEKAHKSTNSIVDLQGVFGAGYALESGTSGETKDVILIWR